MYYAHTIVVILRRRKYSGKDQKRPPSFGNERVYSIKYFAILREIHILTHGGKWRRRLLTNKQTNKSVSHVQSMDTKQRE
jgi:hypothetical protein